MAEKIVTIENGHLSWDKKIPKFGCSICDYTTSSRKDFAKHELTRKHLAMNAGSILSKNTGELNAISMRTCSICNYVFSTKGNLKKHQAKFCREVASCSPVGKDAPLSSNVEPEILKMNESVTTNEVIMNLIQKNSELQNVVMEQSAKILEMAKTPTTIVNSTTNNNHFNMNFFLNAKCKNAVNITDFVNSIQVQVDDLKATGRLGYVDGISRIFINALKAMEIEKRPPDSLHGYETRDDLCKRPKCVGKGERGE